ncbi:diguanylate cyclase domain-containing protein, partial [Klebsiella pneumoniae]|uniref:diguanylate cyclase domain-containing protein n=1 Tax=Klebsiella pneumoniae TaxID=573 RepID=UPI00132F7BFD
QYTIAIVYIDLVNLEDINETMGYEAGDTVIQAVGRRLAKTIRGADTLVRCIFENEDCQTLPIVNDIDREFDSLARLNSDVFALAAVLS